MTTELHTHAVAVDTEIAATYEAWWKASEERGRTLEQLHYSAGDKKVSKTRWANNNIDDLIARAEARAASSASSWNAKVWLNSVERYQIADADAIAALTTYKEAEQKYEGWSRFFWVTNKGGHIHSSMRCSTCYVTTRFAWNPQLSGLTEAEAVEALGPKLCTVCFPSAPVEWRG